jgi:hypothetical protein
MPLSASNEIKGLRIPTDNSMCLGFLIAFKPASAGFLFPYVKYLTVELALYLLSYPLVSFLPKQGNEYKLPSSPVPAGLFYCP